MGKGGLCSPSSILRMRTCPCFLSLLFSPPKKLLNLEEALINVLAVFSRVHGWLTRGTELLTVTEQGKIDAMYTIHIPHPSTLRSCSVG